VPCRRARGAELKCGYHIKKRKTIKIKNIKRNKYGAKKFKFGKPQVYAKEEEKCLLKDPAERARRGRKKDPINLMPAEGTS
jgi:hypothetical protein